MKRLTESRGVLRAAGTAVAAVVVGTVAAQSADIRGSLEYEGGAAVPKGQIEVYFEDAAAGGNARSQSPKASLESDGTSKTIEFSLTPPAGQSNAASRQIVARLEREDGWLLARGSAMIEPGAPVLITLNTVMY